MAVSRVTGATTGLPLIKTFKNTIATNTIHSGTGGSAKKELSFLGQNVADLPSCGHLPCFW